MDYDLRTRPLYRIDTSSSSLSSPMYGHSMHPRVGGQTQPHGSAGLAIRVSMKPEYRITPPLHLAPLVGDIPRSNFLFDFDFEKKVLVEAEKKSPNWNMLVAEIVPSHTGDPVVGKYVASGLSREAVSVAVASYGDNPVKVQEFAGGYNLLREIGFSS